MSIEELKFYQNIIYSEKTFDVNFKSVSKQLYGEIEELLLCNSDYYNQINTLTSKISSILERLKWEETNVDSLKSDLLEIIFDNNIKLGE